MDIFGLFKFGDSELNNDWIGIRYSLLLIKNHQFIRNLFEEICGLSNREESDKELEV